MPTYEYQCESCLGVTEVFHGFSEEGPKECPLCGAKGTMKKMISAGSGVIFKGSGFYETDYKKKSGTPSKPTTSSSTSKTESTTETKKPEKKETKSAD